MSSIDVIAKALAHILDVDTAAKLLRKEIGSNVSLLLSSEREAGTDVRPFAGALAALFGTNVLLNPDVREKLVGRCSPNVLDDLTEALVGLGVTIPPTRSEAHKMLATRRLDPGSSAAFEYCRVLGFPSACAGTYDVVDHRPPEEVVQAYKPLNPLHDFQANISSKFLALLEGPPGKRAMIALPTGAGKTRTVVETLLKWVKMREGSKAVVWVAQHEELCEQAIACIRDVWQSAELSTQRDLRVQRVFESKSLNIDWTADVIVGIPESLSPRLAENAPCERLGAVIIDEAHLTAPPIYNEIFDKGSQGIIVGLSATPENPNDPTGALCKVFDGYLITADELGDDPVGILERRGVLANVVPEEMTAVDVAAKEHGNDVDLPDFDRTLLEKVGRNPERQAILLNRLLAIRPGIATLCFAPSVHSARALSAAMAMRGRTAAYVDYGVTGAQRRQSLEAFRNGSIQFLFNYQVLATGFDAPKIECLVLGRPTRNRVLYEQMIGRGMRGPENGGTETCRVLFFADQFSKKSINPRSYAAFANAWKRQSS